MFLLGAHTKCHHTKSTHPIRYSPTKERAGLAGVPHFKSNIYTRPYVKNIVKCLLL